MTARVLVTAGLPYANGSLHLGHLVEYCQADIYVRALKRLGTDAVYLCADDAHGTPIEVNAARLGVKPQELVDRFHREHQEDFARFDVAFDNFGTTHSPINQRIVERVYATLCEKGMLEEKEIDGTWCEKDQRFLPDRFVRGICPKCGSADQYGDVCEVCRSTYSPVDLKQAQCVLCGTPPVLRKSTHIFFRLSDPSLVAFLSQWIESGVLQEDVKNYVRSWIDKGLLDWCITRDGPYFGFSVPDRPRKFFYVWLDAPLGYIASAVEWGEKHGFTLEDLFCDPNTRIEHVIGKDIVYFHTLFWPAVLKTVGYSLPQKIHVHGMLTVNGEKMSKSRGTFINAQAFAGHVDPQALRYYYASKYGAGSDDLDLALDDFVQRVNAELVNKHANLFNRAAQFLAQRLDGRLGDLPFSVGQAQENSSGNQLVDQARRVVQACRRTEQAYRERQFGQVCRELSAVADIGNEYFQSEAPWTVIKEDEERARQICTFALNICHALAMYLWPIVPRFSEAGARILNSDISALDSRHLFAERNRTIGTPTRLFDRLERKTLDALVKQSQISNSTPSRSSSPSHRDQPSNPLSSKPMISFDQFQALDLRIGHVKQAEAVPKSKKLLKLQVDLGEETPRQIVAGLANSYGPEQLIGTAVIVVANLAPATIMGVESQGMVLAGGDGNELAVLRPDSAMPPGTAVR